MVVYHNPKCSKSRSALDFLKDKGVEFELREYIKEPLTKKEMIDLLKQLNISAEELVRKNEEVYKENFKGKKLSDKEWVEAFIEFPKLIERPIVCVNNKAVVARPTERILEIL